MSQAQALRKAAAPEKMVYTFGDGEAEGSAGSEIGTVERPPADRNVCCR